jgi:hypothetical protein
MSIFKKITQVFTRAFNVGGPSGAQKELLTAQTRQLAQQEEQARQDRERLDAQETARTRRARGRTLLLNNYIGIGSSSTAADLQRRLGG